MNIVNTSWRDASDRLTWHWIPHDRNIMEKGWEYIIKLCIKYFDKDYILFLTNLLDNIIHDTLVGDLYFTDHVILCFATKYQVSGFDMATLCFVPVNDFTEEFMYESGRVKLWPLYKDETRGIRCLDGKLEFTISREMYESVNDGIPTHRNNGKDLLMLNLLDKEGMELLLSGIYYNYYRPILHQLRYLVDDKNNFQTLPSELIEEILEYI